MKKFITATVIAACIALCAAVWPQSKEVKETHVPSPTPAVCATEAAVAELKTEVQTTPTSEKEKEAVPQIDESQEPSLGLEPTPVEIPAAPEASPMPEAKITSEAAPEPTPRANFQTTRSSNNHRAAVGRCGLCRGLRLDRKPRP